MSSLFVLESTQGVVILEDKSDNEVRDIVDFECGDFCCHTQILYLNH